MNVPQVYTINYMDTIFVCVICILFVKVGMLFEKFVKASGILPYSSLTNSGNWRHVMLR